MTLEKKKVLQPFEFVRLSVCVCVKGGYGVVVVAVVSLGVC